IGGVRLWRDLTADLCQCQRVHMRKISRKNLKRTLRGERGDVPGWVLITLMTAGLVVVIWAIAAPALSGVFQQAIDRVTGF
ncbi:MAG: hypothetical protein JWO10_150, partial [Microbacteriaceae bacterium]|nr:hypothetical protein [Microbacteriaceae bacterium]